jgi:hypothetical protein
MLAKELAERKATTDRFYKDHLVNFHEMELATTNGLDHPKCLWLSERNYLITAK